MLSQAQRLHERMVAIGQVKALRVHLPFEQLLKALTGRLTDPTTLNDEHFDEDEHSAEIRRTGSRSGEFVMHFLKGVCHFYFGDPAVAVPSFRLAGDFIDAVPSIWHLPIRHHLLALAACQACDALELDEAARSAYRAAAEESLAALQRLAAMAPVNFGHRVRMVDSELARRAGRHNAALAAFDEAIFAAQEGGWISDVAIANELAARCCDDPEQARKRLRSVRTAYAAWGASGKSRQLSTKIEALA